MAAKTKAEFFETWKLSNPKAATHNPGGLSVNRATYDTFSRSRSLADPGFRDMDYNPVNTEAARRAFDLDYADYLNKYENEQIRKDYDKKISDVMSREATYNTLADQIAGLARNTSGLGALPSLNPQPVPPAAAQGATLPTFGLGGGAPARPTTATSKDYIGDAVKIVTEYAEKINKATADKKTDEVKKLIDERNKNIQDLASDYVKTTQAPTAASTPPTAQQVAANITGAVGSLSAFNNYGASDLSSRLNFQVSNQQILDDYNTAYAGRLSRIVEQGSAQIAGIQERLNAATKLLAGLPANDARRKTSDQYISELRKDLTSVQGAVSQAIQTQKNFKPLALSDPKAQTQITQFREYLKLPEERSLDQIRQIDPATFSLHQLGSPTCCTKLLSKPTLVRRL